MVDDQFADAKAAGGGQHGHEAVQFAVELHLVEDLAPIALHAAVVVVQTTPVSRADQPVEQPRRPDLVPGIVADLLPTADDVAVFLHLGQEAGISCGIVLKIGVEGHDQFAPRRGETGVQGGRFAEIAAKADPRTRGRPPPGGESSAQEPSREPSSTKITSNSSPWAAATSHNSPCSVSKLSDSFRSGDDNRQHRAVSSKGNIG